MYLHKSILEDFTLIQITVGILNAIDLRLKQGRFYWAAKVKRRLENEFAEFKGSFPKREGFQSMLRPGKYYF